MNTAEKILDKCFRVLLFIAEILICIMVVVVFTNVVLRYVFKSGIEWSEEISLIIMVWFTFISMALGVRENLHININILPKKTPGMVSYVLFFIKYALEIAMAVIMFYYGIKLTINGSRSYMPASGLPNSIFFLVMPVSALFICAFAVVHIVSGCRKENREKLISGEKTDA